MKFFLTCVLFALIHTQASSQINVYEQPDIRNLMSRAVYNIPEYVKGWSVQLLVTDNKQKVEQAKLDFLRKYPNVFAEVYFESPTYRLRVGGFLSQAEARNFIKQIQAEYPSAYAVIKDKIRTRDLYTFTSMNEQSVPKKTE